MSCVARHGRIHSKTAFSGCLQLLVALDVGGASAQEVHELRGLLREALRGCKDSGASQELESWQEGLNSVEEGHAEEMSREQVMDLICVSGPAACLPA